MVEKGDRIPLGKVREAGVMSSGEFVAFTFHAHDGRELTFSCPHEAISQIVTTLEALAEAAWKQRGCPATDVIAHATPAAASARRATDARVDIAPEGVLLSILCGPLTHQMVLTPSDCTRLGGALQKAPAAWKKKFPLN
jgi:hypothetical protein